MIRSLLARLVGRPGTAEGEAGDGEDTGGGTDGSDGGSDGSDGGSGGSGAGFTPSRLDASVLEAHGMGTTEAERELASIEEQARIHEGRNPDE